MTLSTVSRTETSTPQTLHELNNDGSLERDTCGTADDAYDSDILNEASSSLNDGFHDIPGDIDVTGDDIEMVNFGPL